MQANFYYVRAPELITLFRELKVGVTSSPVLTIFDPYKPKFLKIDCSAEGMGLILMYPSDDDESQHVMRTFQETGEYLFDLSKNGARLKPISFCSRLCTYFEHKYHSFVGETACLRWEIG